MIRLTDCQEMLDRRPRRSPGNDRSRSGGCRSSLDCMGTTGRALFDGTDWDCPSAQPAYRLATARFPLTHDHSWVQSWWTTARSRCEPHPPHRSRCSGANATRQRPGPGDDSCPAGDVHVLLRRDLRLVDDPETGALRFLARRGPPPAGPSRSRCGGLHRQHHGDHRRRVEDGGNYEVIVSVPQTTSHPGPARLPHRWRGLGPGPLVGEPRSSSRRLGSLKPAAPETALMRPIWVCWRCC